MNYIIIIYLFIIIQKEIKIEIYEINYFKNQFEKWIENFCFKIKKIDYEKNFWIIKNISYKFIFN